MQYLIVDGMLSGTGVRDAVNGGFIKLSDLEITEELKLRISNWLAKYENAHYYQFENEEEVLSLDKEGIEIQRLLKTELSDTKVEYYSNAKMKKLVT